MGEGCRPLVTDGFTWPPSIGINLEDRASPLVAIGQKGTPPAKIDLIDALHLEKSGPDDKVYVTVVGRFETRLHFEMVVRGDGKTQPNGYGHLAACPAQLVYEEMKDVLVLPPKPR